MSYFKQEKSKDSRNNKDNRFHVNRKNDFFIKENQQKSQIIGKRVPINPNNDMRRKNQTIASINSNNQSNHPIDQRDNQSINHSIKKSKPPIETRNNFSHTFVSPYLSNNQPYNININIKFNTTHNETDTDFQQMRQQGRQPFSHLDKNNPPSNIAINVQSDTDTQNERFIDHKKEQEQFTGLNFFNNANINHHANDNTHNNPNANGFSMNQS